MQVGIEGGVLAEIGEYQCEDNQRPKSIQFDFAPGLRRCLAVVDEEFLGLLGHHGKQGEEDHHEEDGAHQRQGAEESEVAHGLGLHENETGKGRHRGEVADDQRLDDILQGLAFVGFLLDVVEIMQGIVDRYTQQDRNIKKQQETSLLDASGRLKNTTGIGKGCSSQHIVYSGYLGIVTMIFGIR